MTNDQGSSDPVFVFNQMAYKSMGFGAQRRYPNEELCRFMGRNYFSVPTDKRCEIKIFELGSGTASNLWMIAKEGFDAYGIDLASWAIPLARNMLDSYGVKAAVQTADMNSVAVSRSPFRLCVGRLLGLQPRRNWFSARGCGGCQGAEATGAVFRLHPRKEVGCVFEL